MSEVCEHQFGLIDSEKPFTAGCTKCPYWTTTKEEYDKTPVAKLLAYQFAVFDLQDEAEMILKEAGE